MPGKGILARKLRGYCIEKGLRETSFDMNVLYTVNVSSIDMVKEQIKIINKSYEEEIDADK
jgi:hypothetical protein